MAKPPVASGSNGSKNKLTPLEARINKAGLAAPNATITQKELLEQLDLTPTSATLDAFNSLLRKALITMFQNGKQEVSFKFIGKDAAKTMGNMESDEKMIYEQIKDAGNLGMWTKTLTENTGIPRVNMTRALKTLESRKLIVSIKSVKTPTRKMYILAGITPSVEITGGPWFTDNELDTEFIEQLKAQASFFLKKRTVPVLSRPDATRNTTYPTLAASNYPTAGEIRKFLSRIITQVDLRDEHVADLLEVMVQDGTVERIFVKKQMDDEDENDGSDDEGRGKKGKGKRKREDSDSEDDKKKLKSRKKLKTSSKSSKKSKKNGKKSIKKKKKSSSTTKLEDDSDEEEESSEEDFDSDEDAEDAIARKNVTSNDISKKGGAKRKDRNRKRAISDEDEEDEGTSESSGDDSDEEEDLKFKRNRLNNGSAASYGRDHVYRLTTPYKPRIGRSDMPCGPCPVESFCSEPSRALGRHHNQPATSSYNRLNNSSNTKPNIKKLTKGNELLGRPRMNIGELDGVGMLGGVGAAIGASNEKWGDSGGRVGTGVAPVNPKTCTYFEEWLIF